MDIPWTKLYGFASFIGALVAVNRWQNPPYLDRVVYWVGTAGIYIAWVLSIMAVGAVGARLRVRCRIRGTKPLLSSEGLATRSAALAGQCVTQADMLTRLLRLE
jgi:hypothetical protein